MARLPRATQQVFGSESGIQQVTQFGSAYNGSVEYTTDVATIQALGNWLVGWYNAAIGQSSPLIEDMNAVMLVLTQQLAYGMQEGIAQWDSATVYYSGSMCKVTTYSFTVTSANATLGAVYKDSANNLYTVQQTISAATTLVCTGNLLPSAGTTLIKQTGTGDATITYSASSLSVAVYYSVADSNLNFTVLNTAYWQPVFPPIGLAFQHLAVNAAGNGTEFSYKTINKQLVTSSFSLPSGYNFLTGYLTVPTGVTYSIAGSMNCSGKLTATGTGIIQATGSGIIRVN